MCSSFAVCAPCANPKESQSIAARHAASEHTWLDAAVKFALVIATTLAPRLLVMVANSSPTQPWSQFLAMKLQMHVSAPRGGWVVGKGKQQPHEDGCQNEDEEDEETFRTGAGQENSVKSWRCIPLRHGEPDVVAAVIAASSCGCSHGRRVFHNGSTVEKHCQTPASIAIDLGARSTVCCSR